MPVFKKLKKTKEVIDVDLPAIKQLDFRIGFDCYRDFFTLKNYWKTVNRKQKYAANVMFYRLVYFLFFFKFNLKFYCDLIIV